jgi:dethiobiotin synthetase
VADRPAKLVVVAGTGTEVGKTFVASAIATAARARGLRVAARKPAQSFAPGSGPTDAEILAAATGEEPETVCPPHRWYPVPMAPFMAAEALERPPFTLDDLAGELGWPVGVDLGLVEPAGGVRSPITSDGADTVDLIGMLTPDHVVLVADAGLGTLNAVRLCLDALTGTSVTVVLNRFDAHDVLHRANRSWLEAHVDAAIVDDPVVLLG